MTDAVTTSPPAGSDDREPGRVHLGWLVAGLSAAAGVIHFAMVPAHADNLTDALGFAVVGWFQLLVAAVILAGRDDKRLYQAAVVGNLIVLGLWVWSRTAGLPWGGHAGTAEDVGTIDGVAAILEVLLVVVAARILLAPGRVAVGKLAPALAAVGALGLATVVITSTDAGAHGDSGHSHGDPEQMADDHPHGTDTAGHADLMAQIDADRCDRSFNIDSYWDEAAYLGVDTYQGGAMAADEHSHDPSSSTPSTTDPDPLEGRGSAGLDELITTTDQAGGGEVAAARLVTALGNASEADYEAWKWWLRGSGHIGGGHGHNAAAPDDSGHGSHAGPQSWTAMTDPEDCEKLAEEIELARDTALNYPTAADATEGGWMKVTPYLPGIAAHYIKGSLVDGTFEITEPEMLLYDGNGPDAKIVGLSYYIVHEGDSEPSQGFTGANDHYHRHVGLCIGPGGVIGDSTTTAEDCAARGGRKQESGNGWMSHAWVVPGCESGWGVFSGASPTLDRALAEASGTNDGACAGSGVRDRYGLDTPAAAQPASTGGG